MAGKSKRHRRHPSGSGTRGRPTTAGTRGYVSPPSNSKTCRGSLTYLILFATQNRRQSSSAPQYARSPEDRRLSHSPVQNPRFWQGSTAHRTWNYVQSGAPHRGEDAPAENTRSGDEELDRERAHNVRREQPEEHDRRGRHHGSRHNRDRDRDDPHRSRSHRHHEHGRDRDRDRDRPRRQKKSWLAAFFCFA
ncbi:hypothetical protein GGS24DRAFT_453748 [Hypoxylon argillaceum]|nr:hypothetical protein GGS24DRAFT_453748 [Hypoxylon argillaceum]